MEGFTGRGGNLNATQFRKKYDESELDEETNLNSHFEISTDNTTEIKKEVDSPGLKLNDLINESDSSDDEESSNFKL